MADSQQELIVGQTNNDDSYVENARVFVYTSRGGFLLLLRDSDLKSVSVSQRRERGLMDFPGH